MHYRKKLNKNLIVIVAVVFFVLGLIWSSPAQAASTPSLGVADTFGVLSGTFTNTNPTTINGDVGYTNLPVNMPTINGTNYGSGAPTPQARIDAGAALTILAANSCTENLGVIVDLSTVGTHPTGVYTPGVYCSTGAMSIGTGGITLSGAGTYIFRADDELTSAAGSTVTLANGASSCDVFWTPTAATTLAANTTFKGTIIDNQNAITVGDSTVWIGRALSLGAGVVTTDKNTITRACTVAAAAPSGGSGGISPEPPRLTVIKHVINDSSETAVASDFNISVKIYGHDVSGSPASGEESGKVYHLAETGTSTISELPKAGYASAFSGDCNSKGEVFLDFSDNKFCIITNDDIGAPVIVPPVPPLIDVVKVPSPLALPAGPGPVSYTYTLRNIGTVPVTNVTMVGDTCSPIILVSGDTDGDSKLDINETWIYRCSTTLSQTHTNTVVTTGWANGISAVDIASATVVVGASVVPPLIHVVKKPNVFVIPTGGAVTYAYTVTNPGTAPLSNVNITDDKCTGLPGRVVGHPGDLNKNNLLESNEAWSFTCQTNLTKTTTNTGTAAGSANGLTARDFAIATVVVTSPKLPNTGLPPSENNTPWDIIVPAGIFAVLTFFYFARRKQTA